MQRAIASEACEHVQTVKGKSSKVYASAMAALGLGQFAAAVMMLMTWGPMTLGSMTSSGPRPGMQLLMLLPVLAAPVSQFVVGLVLMAIAARYLLGRLHIPKGRVATCGRNVSTWGLALLAAFLAWEALDGKWGVALLMEAMSATYFGSTLLTIGIALVEGSRLVEIARGEHPKCDHPEWQDTHAGPHAQRLKPRRTLIDLRLGRCPNCKRRVSMSAVRCHSCRAFFGRNAKWKVERG